MATIANLCARGLLIPLEVELEYGETASRYIYALPHVVQWIEQTMPQQLPQLHEGMQDLDEQLDFLFREYIRGADIAHYERAHIMFPHSLNVYELKTPDIRLFGWFVMECRFVVANIDTKARLLQLSGMAAGYVTDTARRRDRLDLDPPKFVTGDISDLLCT